MFLTLLLLFLSITDHKYVPTEVSCVMHNYPYTVAHYDKSNNKLDEVDVDDFWIGGHDPEDHGGCTISIKDKFIYGYRNSEGKVIGVPLVTAHPTSSHDAMVAVDEFRNVKAGEIVKKWREGNK